MEDRVDVSVVIATYHRDAALERALRSLKAQTFRSFEVIVVDDNNDSVWSRKVENIIKSQEGTEIRHIVNTENSGSAKSRNIGVENARGEYITFLDDDDEYLPEKIEAQYAFMKQGGYDFSLTDLELYYENGSLAERRVRDYIREYDRDSLLRYHFMYHMTGTDTLMFRREYLLKVKGFGPMNVGDEFYLMQRAIENGGKLGYLNRCDVKAYVHSGSESMSSGDKKISGENELYRHKKKYFDRFDKKTIRFIRMRHYAVLAYAEMRRNRYAAAAKYGALSAAASPAGCARLLAGREA